MPCGFFPTSICQLGQYLDFIREKIPIRFRSQRSQWEKKEDLVRQHQAELQSRFEEVLQQLHQGRELDTLPRINVPELPQIPVVRLSQLAAALHIYCTCRLGAPGFDRFEEKLLV